jgi:glyoxylase-like metal-dependent hydrolase (beta-lactamase superfamily II)
MRAVSLHNDVILLTSALLHVNCVAVRAVAAKADPPEPSRADSSGTPERASAPSAQECFLIDSPVLPEELELLPSLLEQSHFPQPSGLLATHGDWDHLLGPLAFPDAPLGCAQSTAARLAAEPGSAQRELRAFDEELMLARPRPLSLGAIQGLPVPGRCELGAQELELHPAEGHTPDGMAILIPWADVLVAGDYLSTVEIPTIFAGGSPEAYCATLERLRPLVESVAHVVPGHGPILARERASAVLEEDLAYLRELSERGADAKLPASRRSARQRELHRANVASL